MVTRLTYVAQSHGTMRHCALYLFARVVRLAISARRAVGRQTSGDNERAKRQTNNARRRLKVMIALTRISQALAEMQCLTRRPVSISRRK